MSAHRRLQVFISSTHTDLKEERQAAVEAVLAVGHIPVLMGTTNRVSSVNIAERPHGGW